LQTVLQALLDGVAGGGADARGEFLVPGFQLVLDFGLGAAADGDSVAAAVRLPADRDGPGPAVAAPVEVDRVLAPGAALGLSHGSLSSRISEFGREFLEALMGVIRPEIGRAS